MAGMLAVAMTGRHPLEMTHQIVSPAKAGVHPLTPPKACSVRLKPSAWRKCRSMRPTQLAIGYLRASDVIAANPDHLLYRAKAEALAFSKVSKDGGSVHADPVQLPVLGAKAGAPRCLRRWKTLAQAGKATDHDLTIAQKLAYILSGGDAEAGTQQDESHFIDLEREAFVSLCGEPKTQDRIAHILKTGKPLQN